MEPLIRVYLYNDVDEFETQRASQLVERNPEALICVPLYILKKTAAKLGVQYRYGSFEQGAVDELIFTWCDKSCQKYLSQELQGKECDLAEVHLRGLLDQLEMIATYNDMPLLRERISEYRRGRASKASRCLNCSLWLDPELAEQIECTFSPSKYTLLNTTLCCRCHSFLCNCRITLPKHIFDH